MPIILIILGIIIVDVALRGTEHEFAAQLGKDFANGGSLLSYIAAIGIVGSLGYYAPLKKASDLGMTLIILGLLFSNSNFFQEFSQVIQNPGKAAPSVPLPPLKSNTSQSQSNTTTSDVQTGVEYAAILGAL